MSACPDHDNCEVSFTVITPDGQVRHGDEDEMIEALIQAGILRRRGGEAT